MINNVTNVTIINPTIANAKNKALDFKNALSESEKLESIVNIII